MHSRTDTIQRLALTVAFVLLVLLTLSLSGCAATETTTVTTSPDGVQTTVTKRPVVDPFDLAISQAATELMQGGFQP